MKVKNVWTVVVTSLVRISVVRKRREIRQYFGYEIRQC